MLKILNFFIFLSGFIIAFFLSPFHVCAASFVLQSSQSSLGQSDEYTVNATLSIGSTNGTMYYLRGAFYQSSTTNYCGFTYNGSAYYNGPYTTNNGWTNLLPITVQNSSWSGTLKAKLDTDDAGCSNSGTYNFKIERFTTSGSGTFDSQNEQTLTVTIPTVTPTPQPTATSIPATNTSTPTHPVTPVQTPTSKPTATKIPTVTLTASTSAESSDSAILGSSISAEPSLVKAIAEKSSVNFLALFLIIGAIFILSSCGILFYYLHRKQKIYEENNEQL